jgi:hypothetical protein
MTIMDPEQLGHVQLLRQPDGFTGSAIAGMASLISFRQSAMAAVRRRLARKP